MEAWQERVVAERHELNLKHEKLDNFMIGDDFFKLSKIDQSSLRSQYHIMLTYLYILDTRIESFK